MKLTKTTYVSAAESVIKSMIRTSANGRTTLAITTSKIRNLLAMISEIYNDAVHEPEDLLSEEMKGRIQYLKMRFAYEAGRENSVRDLVDKGEIFSHIDQIGERRENLILFCNYMEALVAYHRYYGGRD